MDTDKTVVVVIMMVASNCMDRGQTYLVFIDQPQ